MDVPQTLGQRIVEAARLAVAAHLHASLDGVHHFRQRVVIGGAGPDFVTDDVLPLALSRSHRLGTNADGAAE
jgi:pyruvate/2-oxoglutarate dehydrogenase complex dihydrolipoamide acyltransferase (E2) component